MEKPIDTAYTIGQREPIGHGQGIRYNGMRQPFKTKNRGLISVTADKIIYYTQASNKIEARNQSRAIIHGTS